MVMMVSAPSSSSTRSNDSSTSSAAPPLNILLAAFLFGTIGLAVLGLPRVSSFSPSSAPSRISTSESCRGGASNVHSWLLRSASTETSDDSIRTLMESQAGGNTKNRRRRKERIRNSDASERKSANGRDQTSVAFEASKPPQELPDPLVPFDSVESVRLMKSCSESNGDDSVRVELVVRSDDNDDEADPRRQIIDPRDLHQTSDFDLWMALRKHVVDVSASQLSVVLGTNYFTSREKLLQDKIRARTTGGDGDGDDDVEESEAILLGDESDEDIKRSERSNSKACAWGIKMEPLAFAQYSDVVEATNTSDEEGVPRNCVEETGMHLLKHVDPSTKKTYVFGASPDGMVTEYRVAAGDEGGDELSSLPPEPSVGLLEIKSLWGRRHKSSLPVFHNCPNRFYDQIQGQMAICDKGWCDLMLFIPPGDGKGSGGRKSKKRKGKSAKKRKKQAAAAGNVRKTKGRNYAIVRVKRNETYWTETVLPALIKFCDEVEAGVAAAKEAAKS
mmetsp:Transcript_3027/g.8233  ORF Transcript_3027/g.8233 Transcript_3027/m.8233 type:complete len:503 (-) Transcript_3027:456-1964(-)|eukprot:CAMPEP_0197186842 /NCGR_PEP_ID=MMETSP1423-20130617/14674_1 /TAXON_ID=476441 /ORGANISM="Pseudo-nitzschia heimii, Strain UNC1101" /LENGTH=502 /DNA_ID=CAMNT_0042638259 /DNA_START=124 /DNA_END=1632 /DNA_ORIENTATION=+